MGQSLGAPGIRLDGRAASIYVLVMFSTSPAVRPTPRTLQPARLRDLREQIARIEHSYGRIATAPRLPFGHAAIDQALPGGGLARGALHEAASAGPDTEYAAAATLFVAGILARTEGPILWVLQQPDLFTPGLAGVGLHPHRILFAEAGKSVLPVMEEGLRHAGLVAVVGELSGRLSLVASRRLQLAAEQTGVLAMLIRRSRIFNDPVLQASSAAVTRWRIAALPSPPPLPQVPRAPGVGPARWRLDLIRNRGGEAASWVVEACDAVGRLGPLADAPGWSDQAEGRRSA